MEIKDAIEIYEKACLAYAREARAMRDGECDRRAMIGPFLMMRAAFSGTAPAETFEVLTEEGGLWKKFDSFRGSTVHAIRFSDGRIWDAVNGWRVR